MGTGGKAPNPASISLRVKVYQLNDEANWDDHGTGHVRVDYLKADPNMDARARIINAGIRIIDKHGKENVPLLFPIFDSYLNKKASDEEKYDLVREGVVIFTGALAKHLAKKMPRHDDRYGNTRLYVGRISHRTRARDLEDLFGRYGRFFGVFGPTWRSLVGGCHWWIWCLSFQVYRRLWRFFL